MFFLIKYKNIKFIKFIKYILIEDKKAIINIKGNILIFIIIKYLIPNYY